MDQGNLELYTSLSDDDLLMRLSYPDITDDESRDISAVMNARREGRHRAWKRTALISVSDKSYLKGFAKTLADNGFRLMASRGTVSFLNDSGIKAWDIADLVAPQILGHRVVTLSREIHAALLADPNNQQDRDELDRLNVPFIGLVYVNFYPLEEEITRPGHTLQSVIEKTDIGGPTLLRAAAKGGRITVCRPSDFERVINLVSGKIDNEEQRARTILSLASVAEREVARHCMTSAGFLAAEAGIPLYENALLGDKTD